MRGWGTILFLRGARHNKTSRKKKFGGDYSDRLQNDPDDKMVFYSNGLIKADQPDLINGVRSKSSFSRFQR